MGNIEGREAMCQGVDVLVCDGYSGNIFLKTIEGTALFMSQCLKEMFLSSTKTKLCALAMKEQVAQLKRRFDAAEIGGTALLGISKPVIKAHGSSSAYAFFNAVRQAKLVAGSGIIQDIDANVEHMRLTAEPSAQ